MDNTYKTKSLILVTLTILLSGSYLIYIEPIYDGILVFSF